LGQASGLVVRVVAKSFFRSLEEAPGLGGSRAWWLGGFAVLLG